MGHTTAGIREQSEGLAVLEADSGLWLSLGNEWWELLDSLQGWAGAAVVDSGLKVGVDERTALPRLPVS